MKKYEINDSQVLKYSFQSMSDFLEYILTQPINDRLFTRLESAREDDGYVKFSKTKTFEEAVNLCRFGYFENFEKFYRDKILLEPYITIDGIGLKTAHDYVGFCPDIKAYTEGHPLNMFNKVPYPKSKISIYFCIGMSGADNDRIIYNRGVITLNLIEAFERLGYAVDLHFFDLTKDDYYSNNQYLLIKWLLKKENERLNPQLIYFPMCHPSFTRRLRCRLVEQVFDLERGFSEGYGYKCSLDEMQEILSVDDKRIIIGWSQDMDVNGKNLIEDTESMLKTIEKRNMQKTLKIPMFKRK